MRIVCMTDPGKLELNYTWLPTWIGMNAMLLKEIQEALEKKIIGRAATSKTLDDIHDEIVDFLTERFPKVEGLRDYLDGIKFISVTT